MLYRKLKSSDIPQITELYNWYIVNGVESFETEPLTGEQMRRRAEAIAAEYPYYVAEDEGGRVAGYCYAHPWKERAAYSHTLETRLLQNSCSLIKFILWIANQGSWFLKIMRQC